ncbi:hypothetical protein CPB97_007292 [Podila verticillata]|nr:hypothetical protein CPB97_007292 [Podila verticillata]
MSLFVCQTILGSVQYSILSRHALKSKVPSSFITSFNIAIAIGAIGTLICHIFAVLFGAGIIHQAKETMQFACYLSLLSFYPASFVLGTDIKSWLRIFIHNSPETFTEAALYCQGMMAIFGAWLGSIVIPLDWDRPWQAWPVPSVLGAFLFYMVGTIVGLVVSIVMRQRAVRREFGIGIDRPSVAKVKKA